MPYGCFNGIVAVALPYLLRRQGVPVGRIAAIAALVQAPAIWYVLWAPIVDIKFRRRTWIVTLGMASGAAAAIGVGLTTPAALRGAIVLLVLASALSQPVSSALGGLVAAVVPSERRGTVAGWSQAGVLAGGVAAGGLAVWLADHASQTTTAIAIGLAIGLPSLAALFVAEPRPDHRNRLAHVKRMIGEVAAAVRRREVWLGIGFFVSPAAAGALMNLFSGVSPDYHASPTVVIIVVALGGVLTALGALVGGNLLDRFDRWRAYALAGLLTSVVVAAMLVAPLTPVSYILGAAGYALFTGFGYAAFMALALDLIGADVAAGGTLFTLFTAAVNIPVVYMLRLDGIGHTHFGVRGMLAADGLCNAVAAVLLLLVLARVRPGQSRLVRTTQTALDSS